MLGDAALLDVWDRGERHGALDRAVLLAAAAGESAAADLPVDARDRRVLALGAELGGDAIPVVLTCSACGEAMDATLSAAALAATGERLADVAPPTSRDLADALALTGDEARRRLLAARAAGVDAATLEPDAVDAIEARLAAAAGPEDVRLHYECPACAASGEAAFDPAAHVWSVLATRAQDVTETVAALAHAYGWTEAEVLGLSPGRRARYRELAG